MGTSFDHETSFKVLVLGTFLCFAFYVDVLRKYRFMISSVINVDKVDEGDEDRVVHVHQDVAL